MLTRRSRSDIAIAAALAIALLANTVLAGASRLVAVYVALGIVATVAIVRASLGLSILLAGIGLAALVVATQL